MEYYTFKFTCWKIYSKTGYDTCRASHDEDADGDGGDDDNHAKDENK